MPHQTFPALVFDPHPYGFQMPDILDSMMMNPLPAILLPEDINEIAFYSITELASLLRSGQISSIDLTILYLERLKKYDPILECAISITEDMHLLKRSKLMKNWLKVLIGDSCMGYPMEPRT